MPVKSAGEKIGITDCCGLVLAVGHAQLVAQRPADHRALGDVIQQEAGEARRADR